MGMDRLVREHIDFKRGIGTKKAIFSEEKRVSMMEEEFQYLKDVWEKKGYPIDRTFKSWGSHYNWKFDLAGYKYEVIGAIPGKEKGWSGWKEHYPAVEEGWNIKEEDRWIKKGISASDIINWLEPIYRKNLEASIKWYRKGLEKAEDDLKKLNTH